MHHGEPVDLRSFTHWARVEVRYSDFDTQGHVNNATYFTYLEQARVHFLNELRHRTGSDQRDDDLTFVVGSAACVYRHSITAPEAVRVGLRCSRIGRASFDLAYVICDEEASQIFATGETTHVCISPITRKPQALPDWAKQRLSRAQHATHIPENGAPTS